MLARVYATGILSAYGAAACLLPDLLGVSLLLLAVAGAPVALQADLKSDKPATLPAFPIAHAHNDYEHPRPLLDALDLGFGSVEADIWLVDGKLLVAHDRSSTKAGRTLESLYLELLRNRVRRNGGQVHPGRRGFILLIDVKSDAVSTYSALREVLLSYAEMLTTYTSSNRVTGAVTVILSGNRAMKAISDDPKRLVAIDGRLPDLDSLCDARLVPWISDNWERVFQWRGRGDLSAAERTKLRGLVQRAHAQGCQLRFWGAPDSTAGWRELRDAGVDIIGSDNLRGLADFLRGQ